MKLWDSIFFDFYESVRKDSLFFIDCIALALILDARDEGKII